MLRLTIARWTPSMSNQIHRLFFDVASFSIRNHVLFSLLRIVPRRMYTLLHSLHFIRDAINSLHCIHGAINSLQCIRGIINSLRCIRGAIKNLKIVEKNCYERSKRARARKSVPRKNGIYFIRINENILKKMATE